MKIYKKFLEIKKNKEWSTMAPVSNGMKNLIFTFFVTALFFGFTQGVFAGEIHYGALIEQHDDTLLLEYKGPSGTKYYTCDVSGDCDFEGADKPDLFPVLMGSKAYVKSVDGTLGVKMFTVGSGMYYFLYDISTKSPKKIALIPYKVLGAKVHITSNNSAVIFEKGNTFTRYDIETKKLSTLNMPKKLSFQNFSPNGKYIAGYNYSTLSHEIWSFDTKTKKNTPSSMQSYLEFSNDESTIAFLEDVDSFKTLFTMKLRDVGKTSPASLVQLTKPDTETEDYIFVDDTLYFIANKKGPLYWHLYQYDDDKTALVDEDVSYGDYLKKITVSNNHFLAYLKTEGKNTNIFLHTPDTLKTITLEAVRDSRTSRTISREVKIYGDRVGVLLSPERKPRDADLFIWMHGGPQRQVSLPFHPYLSYAVYDELLERLAEAGNYVFKIDYTGSSGYGADFRKALTMHVGDIEITDIRNAIRDIEADVHVDNVYLIGNSYGGYMALRGIVDIPKKLSGAISINGVSDWYGLIQQIPSSPFSKVFNGPPDTHNLDAYLTASVFSDMDDLSRRDKVLVVYGENDSTVPVWQSTKYVEYAEHLGVNVETLSFHDEDHILRTRKNLDTLCNTISDFFSIDDVDCDE